MERLYTLGIKVYGWLVRLAAWWGNPQAKAWVAGRKAWPALVQAVPSGKRVIWFHTASAGEFEQARPLMEHHRRFYPKDFILLTFYSPSGYELRKNYVGADLVCYLPEDRPEFVSSWLDACRPALAVFIKYEFWYHHFRGLKARNIPLLLVSAPFRKSQPFFKPLTRKFWGEMLKCVTHFFVQDEQSAKLLSSLGHFNHTVGGDTRTDRVLQLAAESFIDPVLEAFARNHQLLVAGSTWLADEILLQKALESPALSRVKLLIAPHEVNAKRTAELLERFGHASVPYSKAKLKDAVEARVLVLNTMGMLSKAYRYGTFAYVGGGFGKGIHNTLEAAVYGIPVCFGPKNQKFLEAQALLAEGLAVQVTRADQLEDALKSWSEPSLQEQLKNKAARWFAAQQGASLRVSQEISRLLAG